MAVVAAVLFALAVCAHQDSRGSPPMGSRRRRRFFSLLHIDVLSRVPIPFGNLDRVHSIAAAAHMPAQPYWRREEWWWG